MVADEQPHAAALHGVAQRFGLGNGVRQRLFDECRHTGRNACQRLRHVQRIRGRDDDAVRHVGSEQGIERGVMRDRLGGGERAGGWRRVDDGGQRCGRAARDLVDVPPADQPGPHDGNARRLHDLRVADTRR